MKLKIFNATMDRRRFMQLTRTYGYTAVAVTALGGAFFTEEAVAQTAKEEKRRQKAAKSTMNLATEYVIGATRLQVPASRAFAMAEMAKAGTKYYAPNDDELSQWKAVAGAQRPEWNDLKKKLAGSLAKFDEFREAAETQAQYYVNDVEA